MATKILYAPKQSDAVMEIARSLTPPGFELVVADIGTPEFYEAAPTAEFYLGLARQMGDDDDRGKAAQHLDGVHQRPIRPLAPQGYGPGLWVDIVGHAEKTVGHHLANHVRDPQRRSEHGGEGKITQLRCHELHPR